MEELSARRPAVDTAFVKARELHESGQLAEAAHIYRSILTAEPAHFDAAHLLGLVYLQRGEYADAERQFSRAIEINPHIEGAYNNRGNALKRLERLDEALVSYDKAIALKPDFAEAFNNRANALQVLNRPDSALASYDKAIAFKPGYADAFNNRGILLYNLNRLEDALASYERAIELKPGFAEAYNNRGITLNTLGRVDEALESYNKAIALKPGYADAFNNRGIVLHVLKRFDDALESYNKAIEFSLDYAQAINNRGVTLRALDRSDEALASYDRAIALIPDYLDAIANRATILSELNRFSEAISECERALAIDPGHAEAFRVSLACSVRSCDWSHLESHRKTLGAGIQAGSCVVSPFHHRAYSDSEEENLHVARNWLTMESRATPPPLWRGELYRHDKIRIAYLSSDFRDHAISFLMAGVFAHHDKRRFETIAISNGSDDRSDTRALIMSAFDRFVDVRNISDNEVGTLLRTMEIDIAVDLNGYTKDNRTGVLAFRPAPIQVNYLGYPGTIGRDYLDYIIADRLVIPEENRVYYSEKVVYLPDTYQANTKRKVSDKIFTRAESGLPEAGFVFCSFNNTYKIMPEIFDIWMRLLHQVEHSVLWLFEDNSYASANLRRAAQGRGIAPERLIFATRMKTADHLARQRLADLFLDTLPYNAHTTASDALWMGLPVLTCPGHTFPGRVAASLLHAIGLPELVSDSLAAYEALALDLARHPARLGAIKMKLAAQRDTFPLFDTGRFTRNLEAAFAEMWRRHRNGAPPESFSVPGPVTQ